MSRPSPSPRPVWLVAAALGLAVGIVCPAPAEVAGYSDQDALRWGARIYREGLLPSGKPVQAVVQEDIPVDGTMFSCMNCHLRSGLGNTTGRVVVPPTDGGHLYRPRPIADIWKRPTSIVVTGSREAAPWESLPETLTGQNLRPPYTDATLATALRTGRDPTGRQFDPLMPRYRLGDTDIAFLIHYLKALSSAISPGVEDTALHVATVVCSDAAPGPREAFLTTLQAYVSELNARPQRSSRGDLWGSSPNERSPERRLELSVWELRGPRETWPAQLEAHYRERPVFAILGGISGGSWAPIHSFCEAWEIPCIFPVTDLPVISEQDWYTLYFSKGVFQEGESAARYLHGPAQTLAPSSVVQVYREGSVGETAARGFRKTWTGFGRPAPREKALRGQAHLDAQLWSELCPGPNATVLLWLGPEDIARWEPQAGAPCRPDSIFGSATLLGAALSQVPPRARKSAYFTFPYALPDERAQKSAFVETWLRARGLAVTDLQTQAKAYFLGWVLSAGLREIRENLYRDYFLDMIDLMVDQTYAIAVYPRLSFGPGQRYAAKGCYIVQLGEGEHPALVARSEWVSQ